MRSRDLVGAFLLAAAVLARADAAGAAPKRKPLGRNEREAVLALIKAVDLAQANDTGSDPDLAWDHHILKSTNYNGYVPFTLTPAICSKIFTTAAPSCLLRPWARAIW